VKLNGRGVMLDLEYKITIIDFNMTGYRDDPVFLAKDIIQVFYVMDMHVNKTKVEAKNV
jgi:hypothetical protein